MAKILLLLAILWFFKTRAAAERRKRVVGGIPIGDRHGPAYSVIGYFVWIGYGRPFFKELRSALKGDLISFSWRRGRQACGGALLTRTIVQSACHCFCEYETQDKFGFSRAARHSHTYQVVAGHSTVIPEGRIISVDSYVIHPHCGYQWGWLIYDYALLGLEEEVHLGPADLAPVYPMSDIARLWNKFTFDRNVCLLVGFGRYISLEDNTKSEVLRHAWRPIMSFRKCYEIISARGFDNVTEYLNSMTKTCYRSIYDDERQSFAGRGDSGSPVTCDNMYFGVHSTTDTNSRAGMMDDVVFFAFANSLEYRDALIASLSSPQDIAFRPEQQATIGTPPANLLAVMDNAAWTVQITFMLDILVTGLMLTI